MMMFHILYIFSDQFSTYTHMNSYKLCIITCNIIHSLTEMAVHWDAVNVHLSLVTKHDFNIRCEERLRFSSANTLMSGMEV